MATWPLVKVCRIRHSWPVLATGAMLVDLPGVRDANAARGRVAEGYLKASWPLVGAWEIGGPPCCDVVNRGLPAVRTLVWELPGRPPLLCIFPCRWPAMFGCLNAVCRIPLLLHGLPAHLECW